MDRHRLWRNVETDYKSLTDAAPEGYEVVVEAHVAGRGQPIELGFVETHRGDYPWIRLQARNVSWKGSEDPEDVDPERHPKDRWIHVHETNLLRIELSYRRLSLKGDEQPFGFRFTETGTDDPTIEPQ